MAYPLGSPKPYLEWAVMLPPARWRRTTSLSSAA